MTTKIIRLVVSQTKEELVSARQPLEFFATIIYEETLGTNGVPRHDLENVVNAWSITEKHQEAETLKSLKRNVRSILKHKGILQVRWTHDNSVWEL